MKSRLRLAAATAAAPAGSTGFSAMNTAAPRLGATRYENAASAGAISSPKTAISNSAALVAARRTSVAIANANHALLPAQKRQTRASSTRPSATRKTAWRQPWQRLAATAKTGPARCNHHQPARRLTHPGPRNRGYGEHEHGLPDRVRKAPKWLVVRLPARNRQRWRMRTVQHARRG